ncbi:Bug family tripartite tricarboxylate transporter substrate binding protein [Teichococcus oryzae]|uniref:Tripartite tricarboxylate transporter substrate binding protein n=1 Tax=Teichococcus oryzae TaxID=1608942 RepID=A0A5B2TFD8_9PROT|nr:tripartite tricarboxylate transporter substrate binding protein [Pseudoroseomonas oryzae]KAA2212889.1 tripartite tricarboxylate transporter substrate binding protein [Pseudoroseomonas oryzae]
MNTKILRRALLQATGLAPFAAMAQAPDYPDRPVRIVVPYSAGGGTDVTARAAAQRMSPDLGQPVIIENRAGANTAIGAENVARSRPDGYSLLISGSTTFVLLPLLSRQLSFGPADFTPVSQLTQLPMAMVVSPSVEGSLPEIIGRVQRAPSEFIYAHTGMGSAGHLMGERLFMNHALHLNSVPYRGFSQTLVDLMSGRVPMTFESVPAVMPFHREGKVRIAAVSSPQRLPNLPEVPTFVEMGYPGMAFFGWFGLAAPAGTPEAIVRRLADAVARASRDPGYRAAIEATGQQVVGNSPDEFAAVIKTDIAQWRAVVEPLNIRLD